jgi:hypothetical protein
VRLLFLVLATWRATSLLVNEDGPFEAFAKFRYWAGVRYDSVRGVWYGENTFAEGLTCVWCVSLWTGFMASFFSGYSAKLRNFFIMWQAISALVILFDETINAIGRKNLVK